MSELLKKGDAAAQKRIEELAAEVDNLRRLAHRQRLLAFVAEDLEQAGQTVGNRPADKKEGGLFAAIYPPF
jgi:hypothetical protein